MIETVEQILERIKKVLSGKELYTPKDLVKLGVYGSKSGVHRAVRNNVLEHAFTSDRRLVIFKDSILRHIEDLLKKRMVKAEK